MTKDQQKSHDFDGTLRHLVKMKSKKKPCCIFSDFDFTNEEFKDMVFALKLAKIVTSDPSEEMVDAGYVGDRSAEGSLASYQEIFKIMINQVIKEIENTETNQPT